MVYYRIDTDQIFLSSWLDAHFFGLVGGIKWELIEVLDYFGEW
jgi:hypothetical protein